MKIAIMQPYFFPYIGYWQLMNAVDQYVVFNDVNYINRGWINRNRILCQGKPLYINLLLSKASQNKKINEIEVVSDTKHFTKVLRTLESCYCKAPHFKETFELISHALLDNRQRQLDRYLYHTMQVVRDYLDITVPMTFSSDIFSGTLRGENRIIDICEKMGADQYCNAIGGQALYRAEHFEQQHIGLHFLKSNPVRYEQLGEPFQENLSIIDMMMFCSKEQIKDYLNDYSFI